jgi:hypothetical protein
MEEKLIICCGSSGWTKVIGWFELIGSAIIIIVLSVLLASSAALWALVDEGKNPDGTGPNLSPEQILAWKAISTVGMVVSIIMLVVMILNLAMAVVLLRGSYNRNPRQLRAWMTFTVICMVIWTLDMIAGISVQTGSEVASSLFSLAFGLAVEGFCLWVVGTHKKEIEASAGSVFAGRA